MVSRDACAPVKCAGGVGESATNCSGVGFDGAASRAPSTASPRETFAIFISDNGGERFSVTPQIIEIKACDGRSLPAANRSPRLAATLEAAGGSLRPGGVGRDNACVKNVAREAGFVTRFVPPHRQHFDVGLLSGSEID